MEYHFVLETTSDDGQPLRLDTAEGYVGGRLDWYHFNRTARHGEPRESRRAR